MRNKFITFILATILSAPIAAIEPPRTETCPKVENKDNLSASSALEIINCWSRQGEGYEAHSYAQWETVLRIAEDKGNIAIAISASYWGSRSGDKLSQKKLRAWAFTGDPLASYYLAVVISHDKSLGSDNEVVSLLERATFGNVLGAKARLLVTLEGMNNQEDRLNYWNECLAPTTPVTSNVAICQRYINDAKLNKKRGGHEALETHF